MLDAVRLDEEEADRQRRWAREGVPTEGDARPVFCAGEVVSKGEVGRRKLWEKVATACWEWELADRYREYCEEVERRVVEGWQVGLLLRRGFSRHERSFGIRH